MRILIAHNFYRLAGGEDRYVSALVDLLSSRHETALFHRDSNKLGPGAVVAPQMAYSRAVRHEIREMIKRFSPDLIHLHNAYPALGPAVHLEAQRERIPLVMTVHNLRLRCPNGFMFTEGEICRRCQNGAYFNAAIHRCFPTHRQGAAYGTALWAHRFLMKLERKVSVFVAPSRFMAERLSQWGISRNRIRTVPNFTEVRPVASSGPRVGGLYLGRLSQEKGLDVLLESLHLAGDPPFCLAGDGPMRDVLMGVSRKLALENTRFPGRVSREEATALIAGSRFVVVPSLWEENAPLALLESMAIGRAAIVSGIGGLPELVADGRGLIVSRGDARDLAAKVDLLMNDDQLSDRLGRQAASFSKRELSPGVHISRLQAAYEHARLENGSLAK